MADKSALSFSCLLSPHPLNWIRQRGNPWKVVSPGGKWFSTQTLQLQIFHLMWMNPFPCFATLIPNKNWRVAALPAFEVWASSEKHFNLPSSIKKELNCFLWTQCCVLTTERYSGRNSFETCTLFGQHWVFLQDSKGLFTCCWTLSKNGHAISQKVSARNC